MFCPACRCALNVDSSVLEAHEPVECHRCGLVTPVGELLIGVRQDDPDDTERDHEGPYFWNR